MFKFMLLAILLTLPVVYIFNTQPPSITTIVGPIVECPDDQHVNLFKRNLKPLKEYSHCFTEDIATLIKNNQLLSKSKWLTSQNNNTAAVELLYLAKNLTKDVNEINRELARIYALEKNWQKAQDLIDEANVPINDPLRISIEIRTGRISAGTNVALLPQIYKNHQAGIEADRALIFNDQLTRFNLTKVDVAGSEVIAGESSMRVSEDGQNIWLTWTDSSGPDNSTNNAPLWRIQSSRSTDGGLTWSNHPLNPLENALDTYHFDPMTAYDPINNFMYAGALTVSYTSFTYSFYIYRWDMINNEQFGPFVFPQDNLIDKALLAVNADSELYLTAGLGGTKFSTNFGQNFSDFESTYPKFSPQPKFIDDCLWVIDIQDFYQCDPSGFTSVVAPKSSFFPFLPEADVPGTFRSIPLRLLAVQPDGDLFIVYPDLTDLNSQDMAIWMSRSSDDGKTWSPPWIVTPDVPGDRLLPWLEIDELGGIHLSYVDTRNVTQDDLSPDAFVDLYYSVSSDDGQTWHESRVTPSTLDIPELVWGDYLFSDYLEMSVGNSNAVFLSFPWSPNSGAMNMYVAKKYLVSDLIFQTGFE